MFYRNSLITVLAALLLATSCDKINLYEKLHAFDANQWASNDTATFRFHIRDSSRYKVFFVLRHTDAYHFNNIWVNIMVADPDSSYSFKREFILADDTRWLGTGMGDVFEHRLAFAPSAEKLRPGTYTFKLLPVMREDPLRNVVNAGIRVERQDELE